MLISIIILVYNRPDLTRQTLDSLWDTLQTTTIDHEVICVDSDSDPKTKQVLDQFEFHHRLELSANRGVGFGKNVGIDKASGDYFYISDNDIFFYPGWLDTLVDTARVFPEAKLIGAFRHPHHGMIKTWERKGLTFEQADQQVGSSWFLSRQTWEQFGPLLTDQPIGTDDAHFCHQVAQAGHWLGSILPYKVYHCGVTNSFGDWSPGGQDRAKQSHPKGILVK